MPSSAEDTLAEQQLDRTRLALATTAAGLGMWDWDLTTDALVWDARSIAMSGLTGQVLTGTIRDTDQLLELAPSGGDDDVALLAVRAHPEGRPRPVEAGPVDPLPQLPG